MTLNDFLADDGQFSTFLSIMYLLILRDASALGSWADEMDALPTARACPFICCTRTLLMHCVYVRN